MTKIATRLLALGAILVALQLAYGAASGHRDTPSTIRLLDRYLEERRSVIYFGDSTIYRGDPDEAEARTTAELLAEGLPNDTVGAVLHDAYAADLFQYFAHYLARQDRKPRAAIFPINLRAFSPERARKPEYQFIREKLYLTYSSKLFWSFYRPLATFRVFDVTPVSQADYLATRVYDGEDLIGTFAEIYARDPSRRTRDMVRASYLYRLTTEHPDIEALRQIAETCERAGIHAVFYTTPVDHELGAEMLTGDFRERIQGNVEVIADAARSSGATFLDLTFALPSERFVLSDFPDTYLDRAGKAFLAERLAEALAQPEQTP